MEGGNSLQIDWQHTIKYSKLQTEKYSKKLKVFNIIFVGNERGFELKFLFSNREPYIIEFTKFDK